VESGYPIVSVGRKVVMDDVTHNVDRVAVGLKAVSSCVAACWKIEEPYALVWVDGRCVNVHHV
jgi:hypothetical protein